MPNILVVDDDVDILTLLEMTLTMHQFKVNVLSHWQDIDDSIRDFKPDLILLDVSLSGADGRDICKRIKKDEKTSKIPVLLFSAHAELGTEYGHYHANGFIPKPFELSLLLRSIREQLT